MTDKIVTSKKMEKFPLCVFFAFFKFSFFLLIISAAGERRLPPPSIYLMWLIC